MASSRREQILDDLIASRWSEVEKWAKQPHGTGMGHDAQTVIIKLLELREWLVWNVRHRDDIIARQIKEIERLEAVAGVSARHPLQYPWCWICKGNTHCTVAHEIEIMA